MSPNLTLRCMRSKNIKAILTVYFDTTMAYIISLTFHLKSFIVISNSICHHTYWLPMDTGFPSGKTLNANLTFFLLLNIALAHKFLPFLALKARASSTVLESSVPKLWLFFKCVVCHFLKLAIILSLSLSICLTHQLKADS